MTRPSPRTLLAGGVAVAAWLLGFLMGGWRRSSPDASSTSPGQTSIPRPSASALAAGRDGHPIVQEGSTALQRQSWTHDRLLTVGRGMLREGNIVSMVRRGMQIADQLEAADFPLAIEVGAELKDQSSDADIFNAMAMARWAELNPQAAAEYLVKRPGGGGFFDIEGGLVWGTWGTSNPAAAAAYARQIPKEEDRKRAFSQIAEALARRDPAEALAFAKANAPELLENGGLSEAIGAGANTQKPEEAARQLAGLGETRKLDDAAERWAHQDRPAALAWAHTVEAGKLRSAALEGIYREWFATAPREAADAVLREPAGSPEFGVLANLALTHWPKEDTAGAAVWAARLPSGVDLSNGYGYLAERAGRENPAEGAKWLETLPASGARDEAVARYTTQVVEKDGGAALEWAHTIADPAKRVETMKRLTGDWFRRSPGEAFDWLQNNPLLTPEEKRAVLNK